MNAIRCPQCKLVNAISAVECQQCQFPFRNLPPTAYVSVPAPDFEKTATFGSPPPLFNTGYAAIPVDNETGRKVNLWYRIYCGTFVALWLFLIGLGVDMFFSPPGTFNTDSPDGQIFGGIFYMVLGSILVPVYATALFSPRKPWSWIFGIVLLAIGIVTCCFLPSLILLIFWVKSETRTYFGRT